MLRSFHGLYSYRLYLSTNQRARIRSVMVKKTYEPEQTTWMIFFISSTENKRLEIEQENLKIQTEQLKTKLQSFKENKRLRKWKKSEAVEQLTPKTFHNQMWKVQYRLAWVQSIV